MQSSEGKSKKRNKKSKHSVENNHEVGRRTNSAFVKTILQNVTKKRPYKEGMSPLEFLYLWRFMEQLLVYKGLGYLLNPLSNNIGDIFTASLASEIVEYISRKKAGDPDPGLNLTVLAEKGRFMFDENVEVTPDSIPETFEKFKAAALAEKLHYCEELQYYSIFDAAQARDRYIISNNDGPNMNQDLAAHDAAVGAFVHPANLVRPVALRKTNTPIIPIPGYIAQPVEYDDEEYEAEVKRINREYSNGVDKQLKKYESELQRLYLTMQAEIRAKALTYKQDCKSCLELINNSFSPTIMQSISSLSAGNQFRAIKRHLFNMYGAEADKAANVGGFLNILKNVVYNVDEVDFVEYLGFFKTLVEIINTDHEALNPALQLNFLEESISSGDNPMSQVYSVMRMSTTSITYDSYVSKVSEVYREYSSKKQSKLLEHEQTNQSNHSCSSSNNNSVIINSNDSSSNNNQSKSNNTSSNKNKTGDKRKKRKACSHCGGLYHKSENCYTIFTCKECGQLGTCTSSKCKSGKEQATNNSRQSSAGSSAGGSNMHLSEVFQQNVERPKTGK